MESENLNKNMCDMQGILKYTGPHQGTNRILKGYRGIQQDEKKHVPVK